MRVSEFLVRYEANMDAMQAADEDERDAEERRHFEKIEALLANIDQNSEFLYDWISEYKLPSLVSNESRWNAALLAVATAKTAGDAITAARQMQSVIETAAEWMASS